MYNACDNLIVRWMTEFHSAFYNWSGSLLATDWPSGNFTQTDHCPVTATGKRYKTYFFLKIQSRIVHISLLKNIAVQKLLIISKVCLVWFYFIYAYPDRTIPRLKSWVKTHRILLSDDVVFISIHLLSREDIENSSEGCRGSVERKTGTTGFLGTSHCGNKYKDRGLLKDTLNILNRLLHTL